MKKKGYYIFFGHSSSGVINKINMQIKTLNEYFDVTLIKVELNKRTLWNKIKSRFPWESWGFDYETLIEGIKDPDFIYIRRVTADKDFVSFLEYIKKEYPRCKVLLEVYTYPYDKDDYNRNFLHFISQASFYYKDVHFRKRLHEYIDRIVTFSNDESIFGIKTIHSVNGVIVDDVRLEKCDKESDEITFISVAHMSPHHGYERIIEGLYRYYLEGGKRKIRYFVIGDGQEFAKYNKLVRQYRLQDTIVFCGRKAGEELDKLYDIADIGIASLGLYKYDIDYISSIKTSEYFAKGLIVVAGCEIGKMEGDSVPYVIEFDNDDSAIPIRNVLDFYDNAISNYSCDRNQLKNAVRKMAYDNYDMRVAMRPIVDYITGE